MPGVQPLRRARGPDRRPRATTHRPVDRHHHPRHQPRHGRDPPWPTDRHPPSGRRPSPRPARECRPGL
ncbi:hypothetical protein FrCorBMG51_10300 [Protofrankia coriariae]|uniref:Uncharacterized protein n=1 Tax=Protofrankia coriariae TaxID=1562887 RepID=A0ABR5F463_9ACTN|nr:hypothetical protein FrCorBMG51_10300 [Protofrankia coriariae]